MGKLFRRARAGRQFLIYALTPQLDAFLLSCGCLLAAAATIKSPRMWHAKLKGSEVRGRGSGRGGARAQADRKIKTATNLPLQLATSEAHDCGKLTQYLGARRDFSAELSESENRAVGGCGESQGLRGHPNRTQGNFNKLSLKIGLGPAAQIALLIALAAHFSVEIIPCNYSWLIKRSLI